VPLNPTKQAEAKALVDAFAKRFGPGAFSRLSRAAVADGLRRRIDYPRGIDQSSANLCGPAALVYSYIDNEPVRYAQFGIDLFEKGAGFLGSLEVRPNRNLLGYAPPEGSINQADWMTLASIRNSQSSVFRYDSINDSFQGITLPKDLAGWFRKIGYTQVVNETNLAVFHKGIGNLRAADNLFRNGWEVCLFVNAKILTDPMKSSLWPDHWIVLDGPVRFLNGRLSMDVFTWGRSMTIPASGTLAEKDFLNDYFGYVAARF
jgi:hypothetical protein